MTSSLQKCFVLAAAFCLAAAQSGCPNVTVVQNFDVAAYTGRWYEIESVPTVFQPNASCTTATYTPQDDEVYPVNVLNRLFNERLQEYDSIEGGARPADDSGEGRLKVVFPNAPAESNYWVLETDYTSYALVFSCNNYNGFYTRSSWILSRTPQITTEASAAVEAAIVRNGLDRASYQVTRQDAACMYEPPVVAAACPEVTVQQDFDLVSYTGLWYELERIPSPFEPSGVCVTATYTPQDDVTYPVNVLNRSFKESTMEWGSIEGGARLATNGSEAKLFVKFPIMPVESDYWVLETDYIRYALVYSCNVINGVTFQSSWILSRTQSLSIAAQALVEAAIERNAIDRESYVKTRQDCV